MPKSYSLFINNESVPGDDGQDFPSYNPYTGEVWATIPRASTEQVRNAVTAARLAFDSVWRRTSGSERARLLRRLGDLMDERADHIATIDSTDNGKIIREMRAQQKFCAKLYRTYAGLADKIFGQTVPLDAPDTLDFTLLEPMGVVVMITPWNSPMGLLANKLAPALAAGNCVVIKPSELASASTLEFAQLVKEAGFPAGVVNVVTGEANTGKALLTSGRVDRVSFTGSAKVGAAIGAAAAEKLIPITLELGGKSPNIIFEDADLDRAVVGGLAGIFAATGQTCVAGSRLLVQRSIHDEVVSRLVERAKKIKLGDPLDDATEMGTTANTQQFDRILKAIDKAKADGAKLVTGGSRATGEGLNDGLFIEPTIFTEVDNKMEVAQEEIFGPVLSVIAFDTEEEAIRIANDVKYGLASGVWTQNLSRALRVTKQIEAGTVWVNTYRAQGVMAPFGGYKNSGYGREHGLVGLEEYLQIKNVMVSYSDEARDPFTDAS